MSFELLSNRWHPFSEPVLDRGEFRELSLPVWEDSKSFYIAVLIEFTIITTFQLCLRLESHRVASFVPKPRVFARFIILISGFEIDVSPVASPLDLMLFGVKRCCCVEVALEPKEITKSLEL